MKILFITYCRAMFGANRALLRLMLDMREQYQVEPYVLMWDIEDGNLHEELDKVRIPYLIHPMKAWIVPSDAKWKLLRGLKYALLNGRYLNQIFKLLKNEDFDLIYSNNSTIQMGADLAERMKLPHIWHIREYGKKDYHIDFCYPHKIVKRKFDQADAVITVSKDLEQYVKKNISSSVHAVCIYDGIINKKELRTVWNKEKKLKFCCVGVLQVGKNQLELLNAVRILIQKGIQQFHVTLIGSGDQYEEELREYSRINRLDSYVTFAGYCGHVMEELDHMDVGVICSKSEAFGMVTVEYMCSSMPVIGADAAGTSEIILDGQTGFLYKPGQADQLANFMEKLIDNRELLQMMGLKGYQRANSLFSGSRNTEQIYKVIRHVKK